MLSSNTKSMDSVYIIYNFFLSYIFHLPSLLQMLNSLTRSLFWLCIYVIYVVFLNLSRFFMWRQRKSVKNTKLFFFLVYLVALPNSFFSRHLGFIALIRTMSRAKEIYVEYVWVYVSVCWAHTASTTFRHCILIKNKTDKLKIKSSFSLL